MWSCNTSTRLRITQLANVQRDNGKVCCYMFSVSYFSFLPSSKLKSGFHQQSTTQVRPQWEDRERVRTEYDYKIATMWSRIVVLERYHGGCVTGLIESGRGGESERGRDEGARGRFAEGKERFRGAVGVAAGEYPIPASMHDHPGAAEGTR